jgi:hypothetical protein
MTVRLPDWVGLSASSSVAPRASINRASASAARNTRVRLAAREVVPIIYGRRVIQPRIFAIGRDGAKIVLGALWGVGPLPVAPVISMRSGEPLPATVQVSHVLGSFDQVPHAWLVAAIPGYADTLIAAGSGGSVPLAYSVLKFPPDVRPDISGEVYGPALYDPRVDDVVWPATNPALWSLDWLSNPIYGAGKTVDWSGSIAALDACDDSVGGEPRRWGGLEIDSAAGDASHTEALRTYAGCLIVQTDDGLRLVPRRPAAVTRHIPAAQWIGPLSIQRLSRDQRPTVVTVEYTDIQTNPWTTRPARVYADGVLAGTAPWRESTIHLPGIQSYAVALREATERLNHATLAPWRIEGLTTDESLTDQPCDVVEITHPDGLTAQPARLLSVQPSGPGRWRILAEPYTVALFSDAVATEPSPINTDLPDPSAPPAAVTGLVVTEEIYQQQTGIYTSRLRITWDATDWPYLSVYQVELWVDDQLTYRVETRFNEAVTPAVQEAVEYTVRVAVIGALVAGDWATDTLTAAGKYLPPGDVPSISAFEVGGRVYLSWEPAADIDIWRYRLKYGTVGGDYSTAITLDLIDGLRYQTADIPAGTWVVYVAAVDSVRNESTTPASVTVTVTLDNGAYFVATYTHTAPVATGLAEYSIGPHDAARYWITDDGRTAAVKFPDLASSYTEIAATYHDGSASDWHGEAEDFGLTLSGTWSGSGSAQALTGTARTRIQISADASAWDTGASTAALASARFARLQHASDSGVIKVALSEAAAHSVRLDAIPRSFELSDTSSASAPVTLTLDTPVAKYISVTVQPLGATPLIGVADNLVTGDPSSLDVYVFDAGGTQVAADFICTIRGVG